VVPVNRLVAGIAVGETIVKLLFTWQVAQATETWKPVSGKAVLLWSNTAPFQFVV
jgi:hypothetical protein